MENTLQKLKDSVRDIPDFPKPGILFKDLTTLFIDPELFRFMANEIVNQYKNKGITKVAGIESRGFILGSILAKELNAGFIPIRKPGKLPYETYKEEYQLEYGTDSIEVHTDAFSNNDIVLIHDDLLATGGTAKAAIGLIEKFNVKEIHTNFIVELEFLKGRSGIEYPVDSLITY